jgi:hypothetical protein
MPKPRRKFLFLSVISIGIVELQWVLCRLLPIPVGLISWVPTIIALEALENLGLPTLKGSPDGVPVPTELGLVISTLIWWLVWLLFLYLGSDALKRAGYFNHWIADNESRNNK